MARSRFKSKWRWESGTFVMFQHRMIRDRRFLSLSSRAHQAMFYLASQYTGKNNGDLSIAWSQACEKGIRSNGNLRTGTQELMEAGFVIQTRQGGRNRCSLYALAWFPIDECGGKLDIPATRVAPNDWLKKNELSEPPAVQLEPPAVQSAEERSQNCAD